MFFLVGIFLYTNQHGLIFLAFEMPTEPGPGVSSVVSPANKGNSWDLTADKIFRPIKLPATRAKEAHVQKARCEASRIVGNVYASSGLQVNPDHWVLEWALVKLDPRRITFARLRKVGPGGLTIQFLRWLTSTGPFGIQP